jgi:hypothetical protein
MGFELDGYRLQGWSYGVGSPNAHECLIWVEVPANKEILDGNLVAILSATEAVSAEGLSDEGYSAITDSWMGLSGGPRRVDGY